MAISEIDRLAVARREIEQPPRGGLRQQVRFRLRSKRQRDSRRRTAATVNQRIDCICAAATNGLRFGDDDAFDPCTLRRRFSVRDSGSVRSVGFDATSADRASENSNADLTNRRSLKS